MDENILVVAQAAADAAMAILNRWGTSSGGFLPVHQVKTTSGTIEQQGWDNLRVGPNYNNWHSDWVVFKGHANSDKTGFTVEWVEGDPFQAIKYLESMALFLTSSDFMNKVRGSVSRMKKLVKALS